VNTPHSFLAYHFRTTVASLSFRDATCWIIFSGLGRDTEHVDGSADRAGAVRSLCTILTKGI
jgi:hypothetical protein